MIAHMQVPPENEAAYEKLMTHVAEMTRKHEPGVLYYGWARSSTEPGRYVVIEVYEDEKVHAAHMQTEWVRESLPVSAGLITGRFDIAQYVSPGQEPVALKHG